MDLDAVFLERQHVGAIVILVDPAVPQLRVGFLVLVAVGGAVFDERADRGVDDRVVLPEGVFQIALEQLMVVADRCSIAISIEWPLPIWRLSSD